MAALHAVIMAGGSGTRFWPASRTVRPKQFLPLAHGKPLLQATIDRLDGLCPRENVWIATNPLQAERLPTVVPHVAASQVIVEPEARDTAPCVALAVATIAARDPDAVMILLPADHVIEPTAAFQALLQRGAAIARDGQTLVTFGVRPTHPATGYGYVECGEALDDATPRASRAVRFREKPDLATAEQFVRDGRFLWNSGIFVWSIPAIRAAMAIGNAALAAACDRMLAAVRASDREALATAFRTAPKTSIDYAVMEKAPRVAVVAADLRWDDVGSFTALPAVAPTDAAGNTALLAAGARQVVKDSRDNVVYAEGARTVALFGVHDLVVVAVGDAVLVCGKERAGDLKVLIEELRREGRTELL